MTALRYGLKLLTPLIGLASLATVAHAEVSLRIASEEIFADPPKVAAQTALEYLDRRLPEVTDGEVQVDLYPNAALGSEKELIRSVGQGTVDATVMSPGNAAGMIPEVQLFSASYLFNSYDHVRRVIEDDAFFEAMQKVVADKEAGFQLVGIGITGTRNFYNRERVVDSMEALEGLKMRVMSSPTEFKVWSTLGTLPTNIPAPEIYTSIQTGVVDAGESSLPAIAGNKYYEVAPNITLTHHQFNLHLLLLGDAALARIPEEHREAVLRTFREAGIEEIEAAIELSEKVLKSLREQPGVTVTKVDTKPFADKLRSVQDEVAEDLGVEHLLQMIRSKE
ncbi:MAG: TRAP transporter substrate-binding protein [Tistlia sp.]|uniref:TRAP transporter substrate-binding protein n=1 Tax=Tistlia sp. TaxID=3057121 RepID=UPI0034A568EE